MKMRIASVGRFLCVAVVACTVSGCSANDLFTQHDEAASKVNLTNAPTLIYVCGAAAGECVWFVHGHNKIAGRLTGLASPEGIAVDRDGDVYIASSTSQSVFVFPKGSTTLAKTLDDPGEYPDDVVVDSDGTVYVANVFDTHGGLGSVSVYAGGSTTVSRTLSDPRFFELNSVSLDEHHELVACYYNNKGPSGCDEFTHGRGHGMRVVTGLGFPGDSAFDKAGNLAVVDQAFDLTQFFTPAFAPCGKDSTDHDFYLAFDQSNGDLYKSNYQNSDVEEHSYAGCQSGAIEHVYNPGFVPYGVAVDPRSPL